VSVRLRRLARAALVLLAALPLSAHVGANETVYEGTAGAYRLRVVVRPPGVIPAQVPILVRVIEGSPTSMTVRAAFWQTGTKGAPPAEAWCRCRESRGCGRTTCGS
jgi:hypothetical protein